MNEKSINKNNDEKVSNPQEENLTKTNEKEDKKKR